MRQSPRPTAREIGERIRSLRTAHGFSQDALANKIQRRQATISAWESGRTQPRLEDLYDLALIFDVDVYALLPERRTEPPLRGIYRAIDEQLPPGTRFHAAVEMFLRRTGRSPAPSVELVMEPDEPDALASELLRRGGVTQPPVDVIALAKRCGARVIGWDTFDSLSGLLVRLEDAPLIAFNSNHPPGRQRFTVAHELGHLLLGHLDRVHLDFSAREGAEGRPGFNASNEKQANAFAAALLMPEEWVRKWVGGEELPSLASRTFEVSELALGFRLMSFGIAFE